MARLGFKPRTAEWWAQANPLSYGSPQCLKKMLLTKLEPRSSGV